MYMDDLQIVLKSLNNWQLRYQRMERTFTLKQYIKISLLCIYIYKKKGADRFVQKVK